MQRRVTRSKVKVTVSKVKIKVTRVKENFVCFSAVCLFLYSSQVFGPIPIKPGRWMQVHPAVVLEGFIFLKVKVKVTRVKCPNNGPISIKFGGWMQGRVTGSKIKVTGSNVKVHGYY